MHRLRLSIGSLLLMAILAASTPILARSPQDHNHQIHEWSAGEDPHWHQYQKEQHMKDHDWDHATKKEQKNYWKWRDSHPDAR
jgi:hypothetical protein